MGWSPTIAVLGTAPFGLACTPRTSELHVLIVPDEVATAYSVEFPGLLRTEEGFPIVAVLCGDPLDEPAELPIEHAGCLEDDLMGAEVQRVAWVEPMPKSWDPEALCALAPPSERWPGVQPREDVTGGVAFEEDLARTFEPEWPHGLGVGVWQRNFGSCGAHLRVEIEIEP
jgi:hypothetical protein